MQATAIDKVQYCLSELGSAMSDLKSELGASPSGGVSEDVNGRIAALASDLEEKIENIDVAEAVEQYMNNDWSFSPSDWDLLDDCEVGEKIDYRLEDYVTHTDINTLVEERVNEVLAAMKWKHVADEEQEAEHEAA